MCTHGLDSFGYGCGRVVGSLNHPKEQLNSVKGMKFPDQLIEYELLKEDCFVEWSIYLIKLLE
jgi:hypothetical protein